MTGSSHHPAEELALGANYLRQLQGNAESLLADAQLLFTHQRWARALVLAVLATGEAGKAILFTAGLLPDDDLAELKSTRHEDKLTAAALLAAGFTGDLSDLSALFSQIDSGALHRRKLSAIYVDRRVGGVVSPSAVTHDDAERAMEDARRVVELLSGILGQMSPEAIEYALQLNEVLTPVLDRCVQEHGDAAGLQVARDLFALGQSLSDTESTCESSSIWINHIDESFHNCR
ncbi:MAG: AbiV family abortive infection protein [Actinobacteria bacterium]|nr:AbiV family abortive infection protein [Actinomycetota bacterium]